jgi:AmmeMemoRadiSam system protein A
MEMGTVRGTLTEGDRTSLLRLAREEIRASVTGFATPAVDDGELSDALRAPHGAFVTLTVGDDLRGCMGTLDFSEPLWVNVLAAAASAATRDPRFNPVEPDELDAIRIEVTVLEPPVELADKAAFDPQVHGIIVERRGRRALLLPQVAQRYGWDAGRTLAAVCEKAGLAPDAWRAPDARLSVFLATSFEEAAAGG